MIFGPPIAQFNRVGHYIVDIISTDINKIPFVETVFLSPSQLREWLPNMLSPKTESSIEFFDRVLCHSVNLNQVIYFDLTYIDSECVFHSFEFSPEYIQAHHPELLL